MSERFKIITLPNYAFNPCHVMNKAVDDGTIKTHWQVIQITIDRDSVSILFDTETPKPTAPDNDYE